MHQSEVQMEDWLPCSECKKERSSTGFAVKGKLIQYSLLTVCICSFVLTVFVVCNSFIKDTGQQRILEDVAQLMQKQIQLEKSFANLQMRLVTSEKRNAALQTRLHKTDKSLNKLRNAFGRSLKYSPSFESGYNSIASMDVFSPNNTYANGMDTTLNDLPASHEDIEYQASNNHNRVRRKASSNSKKRNNGKKSKGCKHQLRQCLKQRGRRTTTNGSGTPHFFIRGGSNGNQNDGITQDGIFLWNKGNRQFGQSDVFIAESSGSRVKKLQIQRSGVYYIFADIAVEGRTIDDDRRTRMDNSPFPPPVGYTLYKNDGNNPLRSTFLTQDRMGFKYHSPDTAGYPIDTISLSGLFTLQRGDTIYIQKLGSQINDYRTNYHNIATHASFGGFLVEDFFATGSLT